MLAVYENQNKITLSLHSPHGLSNCAVIVLGLVFISCIMFIDLTVCYSLSFQENEVIQPSDDYQYLEIQLERVRAAHN